MTQRTNPGGERAGHRRSSGARGPQNLVELWVVATRPAGENGLGMSFAEALAELARVTSFFALVISGIGKFLLENAFPSGLVQA